MAVWLDPDPRRSGIGVRAFQRAHRLDGALAYQTTGRPSLDGNWSLVGCCGLAALHYHIEFVQTLRTLHGVLNPNVDVIAATARAAPGSLWLVGNELDRIVLQDSATPVQYARAYHQAYETLKWANPTAGNLFDPDTLQMTALGRAWRDKFSLREVRRNQLARRSSLCKSHRIGQSYLLHCSSF